MGLITSIVPFQIAPRTISFVFLMSPVLPFLLYSCAITHHNVTAPNFCATPISASCIVEEDSENQTMITSFPDRTLTGVDSCLRRLLSRLYISGSGCSRALSTNRIVQSTILRSYRALQACALEIKIKLDLVHFLSVDP